MALRLNSSSSSLLGAVLILSACYAATSVRAAVQKRPDVKAKAVRISGRLVSPDGRPFSYSIGIARIAPDGFKNHVQTVPNGEGLFTFSVAAGHQYRITFIDDARAPRQTVDTSSGKDVYLGDIVFERCPAVPARKRTVPTTTLSMVDLKPEQIIVDKPGDLPALRPSPPRYPGSALLEYPVCWSGPSLDRRSEQEDGENVSFDQYVNAESFMGGKVKRIRVTRISGTLTAHQVRNEVRGVWLGLFTSASKKIDWAEFTPWNVEATVEYEDGKQGMILTDGSHVEVQDREGRFWFMRLWPAAG